MEIEEVPITPTSAVIEESQGNKTGFTLQTEEDIQFRDKFEKVKKEIEDGYEEYVKVSLDTNVAIEIREGGALR